MVFPIGIRLSNPGNIVRDDVNHWEGMTRLQDDKRIARFSTPEYGIRALIKVLINYKRFHDIYTITDIITRYAPPTENNTRSYINDVSARSGFFPNEILNMEDPDTLVKLAQAIVVHENGAAPIIFPLCWYEEQTYYEAASSALEED